MESLLILHAAAAICAPWLTRRLGRDALLMLALVPAAGFAYTVWAVVAGLPRQSAHAWAPALGMSLSFRADELRW